MPSLTFKLQALDQLIESYPAEDIRGHRLLRILRQLTPTKQDLISSQGFSTKKIIALFFENGPSAPIAEQALTLETVREQTNKHLLTMLDGNSNPAGILIDEGFTFIQLKRHKFNPSELAYQLPQTLHGEIQNNLQLLQNQNEEEEKRLQELQEKENALTHFQSTIETRDLKTRKSQSDQLENLRATLDRQRQQYEEETFRLKKELAQWRGHHQASQSDEENRLTEDIHERDQLDQALEEQFLSLESHQKEFATLIEKLRAREADLLNLKKRDVKRIRQRELFLKKSAEAHLERIQAWDQRITEINQAESGRRKQQEKNFKAQLQELQNDFKRQLIHFQLQANEGAEKSLLLEEERQQILIKKQALSGEIQSRIEVFLKKRQEELTQKENALKQNLNSMNHLSTLLSKEKSRWLDTMQSNEGTLYTKAELGNLVQEQEKLTQSLAGFLNDFKTQRKEEQSAQKNRRLELEKERKELFTQVNLERETLKKSIERLNKREENIIERETQELARLHEDYEDLRLSLEVNQIEKREQLDQREDELHQRELKLQEMLQEYQETNRQTRIEWAAQEEHFQAELEELLSTNLEQNTIQAESRIFFDDLRATFQHRLARQKSDIEQFRQQMEHIKSDATMIQNHLEEEAESTHVKQTSLEQTLEERIEQHRQFMESLELDLRDRVENYRNQGDQLRTSRDDLQNSERQTMKTFLENLSRYDRRLQEIGQAFEGLSDTFVREQALGGLQVEAFQPPAPVQQRDMGFSEERAKDEWDLLLHQLSRSRGDHLPEFQPQFLDEWSQRWVQWVPIEPGEFWIGRKNNREALPLKKSRMEHSLQVCRYPVTNIEFMRFVLQTGYRTEAETGNGGIVYFSGMPDGDSSTRTSASTPTLESLTNATWWCPDGSADSLIKKFNHPVTLVTWNDVQAFCRWKSEQTGLTVRLPTEAEWEYFASNLGHIETDLPWDFAGGLRHCNLEESNIGGTTAVDHFPEHDQTGGVLDLFGNVYEWVLDGPPPIGRSTDLDYKLARGGGYLTRFQQVARWRRLAFLPTYRTSFIGFRVVAENDTLPTPVT